jgi:hypothetical protein
MNQRRTWPYRVNTHTSDLPSRSAFFADSRVDPVKARYPSAEACGKGAKLAQVPHLFQPYKVVCHALEVGVYPHNDVERVGIFEEFSQVFSDPEVEFIG